MFNITTSKLNNDVPYTMEIDEAKQYYLNMVSGFVPKMPDPVIDNFEGKYVFRGDLSPAGLKAYGAENLIASCKKDVLVYCAPRVGQAMDSIATLAKMYNKTCVFFCPASKEASDYQAALLSYDNVQLRFIKIAAMPTLNVYAKRWADSNNATFLPFGLSKTPEVTAGLVHLCGRISSIIGKDPTQIWMSVSTGTAIRAFQIGWNGIDARGVVVARNMHDGEIGNASLVSAKVPFLKMEKAENLPYFPTTENYDAKAWKPFVENALPGSIFINVGCDQKIKDQLIGIDKSKINSNRAWKDFSDLERGL